MRSTAKGAVTQTAPSPSLRPGRCEPEGIGDNLTDLATITVHLRPEAPPVVATETGGPDPARAAGEAWESSLDVLRGMASGLVTVAVFSWWLMPLLALGGFLVARVLPRAFSPRPIDRGSSAS